LLHEDALLLDDRGLERLGPFENVAMRGGKLVSTSHFHEVMDLLLVLVVGRFERELLDLKLTLEQIDRVLHGGLRNAMERDSVVLVPVGAGKDQFVKLVDQVVDFGLQHLQTIAVFIFELVGALLHESVHVLHGSEVSNTDLFVDGNLLLLHMRIVKVLVLADLERFLPVFAVHRDHEVLEIVDRVDVHRHVSTVQFLA
jgi:hypothetical protein